MVEDFQKKYESLQIPYPKDTLTGSIANQAVEQKAAYEKFVVESKTRASVIATEMAKWEEMMPIEEMNLEEALEVVPHLVIDDQDLDEWKTYIAKLKKEGLEH